MTQHQFHNALRVMNGIDAHELINVDPATVRAFLADPVRTFIRADDPTAAAIWTAMKVRGA